MPTRVTNHLKIWIYLFHGSQLLCIDVNHSSWQSCFFLLLLKAIFLKFQNKLMCGKAALCAAELTRIAMFVIRIFSYWLLNDELFCAYLCLLVLWELRMYLLNKGADLHSSNTLLTFWNLKVYVFCILWAFFLRVGVLFLSCTVTGVDTLFLLLLIYCTLGFFCLSLQKLSWMISFSHTRFSWRLMTCARHSWGNILLLKLVFMGSHIYS